MTTPWWDHASRQLRENGASSPVAHAAALRAVLQDFSRSGMIDRRDLQRLTDEKKSGRYVVTIGGQDSIPVTVRGRERYGLRVDLTATGSTGEVLCFVLSLTGIRKTEPFASVHLDRPGMGSGACSHAILHCHPFSFKHEVRVPMPALSAAEALRWLLLMVAADEVQAQREPAVWAAAPDEIARMRIDPS